MKIVKTGWIGKTQILSSYITKVTAWDISRDWRIELPADKGARQDWKPEDWPPRRVTITLEVAD
jgi:hypothetical protein